MELRSYSFQHLTKYISYIERSSIFCVAKVTIFLYLCKLENDPKNIQYEKRNFTFRISANGGTCSSYWL